MANFHTKQAKTTYFGLLASALSKLTGESYALCEEKIRIVLQEMGGSAVVAAASEPAPAFRWKRLAYHLRRDPRGLLHELIDEVFVAAGAEPPMLGVDEVVNLKRTIFAQMSAQKGGNHGI